MTSDITVEIAAKVCEARGAGWRRLLVPYLIDRNTWVHVISTSFGSCVYEEGYENEIQRIVVPDYVNIAIAASYVGIAMAADPAGISPKRETYLITRCLRFVQLLKDDLVLQQAARSTKELCGYVAVATMLEAIS